MNSRAGQVSEEEDDDDEEEEDCDAHMTDEIILLPTSISRSRLEFYFNDSHSFVSSTPMTTGTLSRRNKDVLYATGLEVTQRSPQKVHSFPLASTPVAYKPASGQAKKDKTPLLRKAIRNVGRPSPLPPVVDDDVFDCSVEDPKVDEDQVAGFSSNSTRDHKVIDGEILKGKPIAEARKQSDDDDDNDKRQMQSANEILLRRDSDHNSMSGEKSSPARRKPRGRTFPRKQASTAQDVIQTPSSQHHIDPVQNFASPSALSRVSKEVAPRTRGPSDNPMLLRATTQGEDLVKHALVAETAPIDRTPIELSDNSALKSEDEEDVFDASEHFFANNENFSDGQEDHLIHDHASHAASLDDQHHSDAYMKGPHHHSYESGNHFIDPRLLVKNGDGDLSRSDEGRDREPFIVQQQSRWPLSTDLEGTSAFEAEDKSRRDEAQHHRFEDNEAESGEEGNGFGHNSNELESVADDPDDQGAEEQSSRELDYEYSEASEASGEPDDEQGGLQKEETPTVDKMLYSGDWNGPSKNLFTETYNLRHKDNTEEGIGSEGAQETEKWLEGGEEVVEEDEEEEEDLEMEWGEEDEREEKEEEEEVEEEEEAEEFEEEEEEDEEIDKEQEELDENEGRDEIEIGNEGSETDEEAVGQRTREREESEELDDADEQTVDNLVDLGHVEPRQSSVGADVNEMSTDVRPTTQSRVSFTAFQAKAVGQQEEPKYEIGMQTEQELEDSQVEQEETSVEKKISDVTFSTESSLPSPPRAQSMMIDATGEPSFFSRHHRSSTAMDRSTDAADISMTDMGSRSLAVVSPNAEQDSRSRYVRRASVSHDESYLDISMQERSTMLSMRHNAIEISSFDTDAAARAVAVLTQFSDFVQYGSLDSISALPGGTSMITRQIDDDRTSYRPPQTEANVRDSRFAVPSVPASSFRKLVPPSPATPLVPGGFPMTPSAMAPSPSPQLRTLEEASLCASKDDLIKKAQTGHSKVFVTPSHWGRSAWASLDDTFSAEVLSGANALLKSGWRSKGQAQKEALKQVDREALLDVFFEAHGVRLDDLRGEWSRRKLEGRLLALQRRIAIRIERKFPGTLDEVDRTIFNIDSYSRGDSLLETPSTLRTKARSEISASSSSEEEDAIPFATESTPLQKTSNQKRAESRPVLTLKSNAIMSGTETPSLYPKLPALSTPMPKSTAFTEEKDKGTVSTQLSDTSNKETPVREKTFMELASKGFGLLASKITTPLRRESEKRGPNSDSDEQHQQTKGDRRPAAQTHVLKANQVVQTGSSRPSPAEIVQDSARELPDLYSNSSIERKARAPEMREVKHQASPSVASLGATIAELAVKRSQRSSHEQIRNTFFSQKGDSSNEVDASFATRVGRGNLSIGSSSLSTSSLSMERGNSFGAETSRGEGKSGKVGAFGSSRRGGTSGQVVQTALSNLNDGVSHTQAKAKVEEFRQSRSSRKWKSPRTARLAAAKNSNAGDFSSMMDVTMGNVSSSRMSLGETSGVRDRRALWEERAAKLGS